jgi:hypothetical protein
MSDVSPGAPPSSNGGQTDARGRFVSGNTMGKGRPHGSRAKATVAAERLLTKPEDVKAISETIIREARAGQQWACVAWLRLVCPAPRGRFVSIDMPKIQSVADIPLALMQVTALMADGTLTPTEGAEIASVFDALRASMELDQLAHDLADLKERVATIEAPRLQ